MSRDRPTEPPRVVPTQGKDLNLKPHQVRERAELERMKNQAGPGVLGRFFNPLMRKEMRAPVFIRRGYEGSIVDELNAFYSARPRPWRPKSCDSRRQTHKERLNAQRGGIHARGPRRA